MQEPLCVAADIFQRHGWYRHRGRITWEFGYYGYLKDF